MQSEAIVRLNYHSSRRVCGCLDHGDALETVWLVPIAAVLDERRLSSMAAHPSALGDWYWSPKPVENPMLDEELPE